MRGHFRQCCAAASNDRAALCHDEKRAARTAGSPGRDQSSSGRGGFVFVENRDDINDGAAAQRIIHEMGLAPEPKA